jgi:predicted peptidase
MVKDLMQEHPIDPKRIYVMGCSDGGTGAFGAANYYPDVFSAAVSHIGTWIPMKAPDMTKVPIWAFHGGKDEVFPYQRTKAVIDAIRQNGGEAHFSYFEDMGHSCNGKFLYPEELWIWMFKQQKDE